MSLPKGPITRSEILETLEQEARAYELRAESERGGVMARPQVAREHDRTARALKRAFKMLGGEVEEIEFNHDTEITGAEFREFYQKNWPGIEWYHDDSVIQVEDERGEWILQDDARYRLGDLGYLGWQGQSDDPRATDQLLPIADFYKAFVNGTPDTEVVSLRIQKDKKKYLMTAVETFGATLV